MASNGLNLGGVRGKPIDPTEKAVQDKASGAEGASAQNTNKPLNPIPTPNSAVGLAAATANTLNPIKVDGVTDPNPLRPGQTGQQNYESQLVTEEVGGEDQGESEPQALKIYVSTTKKLAIGKYQFENGILKLFKQDEVDEFTRLLSQLPSYNRAEIRTVDIDKAAEIAAATLPRATRGFDSGKNPEAERMEKLIPKTGTLNQGTKESGN